MKKIILSMVVAICAILVVACNPTDNTTKHDVRFMDGTNVLKTVQVVEGEKVSRPMDLETKTGYDFVNWFSTPSKNHKFDFEQEINAAVDVYAGFSQYQEDTRAWYVLGSGKSELLASSDWGKNLSDSHKLTKVPGKNEFTITLDLLKDDEFQFGGADWIHKRGFGYLETTDTSDGTIVFSGSGGGIGEVTAKGRNSKVVMDGNYTITLVTFPADDTYNTSDPSYTEEQKEVYNLGTYDYVKWVRNGDPLVIPEVVTDFYIKGSGVTAWADIYNNSTKLTREGTLYTYKVYLNEDEEFLFTSTNTLNGVSSSGAKYIRSTSLDDSSKLLFDASSSYNIIAKASGLYTFTYDLETDKLSATVDTAYEVQLADYYLTGSYGEGNNWTQVTADSVNEDYKFIRVGDTTVYEISLPLEAGIQFQIEALKAGSTGRGVYATDGFNQLGNYNFTYLKTNPNFVAFDLTGEYPNNNIKPLVSGTYKISFDSYSKIITITLDEVGYDIYIKGSGINGWAANFSDDWKFTQSTTNKNLYEFSITLEGTEEFGFELHDEGATTGYGTFLNKNSFGEAENNVNSKFIDPAKGNFVASEAGNYKIVVDVTDINKVVVNIFLVA